MPQPFLDAFMSNDGSIHSFTILGQPSYIFTIVDEYLLYMCKYISTQPNVEHETEEYIEVLNDVISCIENYHYHYPAKVYQSYILSRFMKLRCKPMVLALMRAKYTLCINEMYMVLKCTQPDMIKLGLEYKSNRNRFGVCEILHSERVIQWYCAGIPLELLSGYSG